MREFTNKIIKENPIFVLFLGLCPVLATTNTLEQAYLMGISVLFVLFFSNLIITFLAKIIPSNIRIPAYILIISTFVTSMELLLSKYAVSIFNVFDVYLALLTVNCIILGRALNVASKGKISLTIKDSLGVGIGYLLAISLIGLCREFIGNNSITIVNGLDVLFKRKIIFSNILPSSNIFPISIFTTPGGGFIMIGLILGIISLFKRSEA